MHLLRLAGEGQEGGDVGQDGVLAQMVTKFHFFCMGGFPREKYI
jgi:hypothetical protein